MCTAGCIIFGATQLSPEQVRDKRVLEVGSCDLNGSLRPVVELWKPAAYVGADIQPGPGVDIVCRAETLEAVLGTESFDVVISTEMIEHVRDWRAAISNLKAVCKTHGILIVTTRSYGFAYHGYPHDFWRFGPSDMQRIFSDCVIEALEVDRSAPGVLLKARKPEAFVARDLSDHALYSVIVRRPVREIDDRDFDAFQKKWRRRARRRGVERWVKQLWRKDG